MLIGVGTRLNQDAGFLGRKRFQVWFWGRAPSCLCLMQVRRHRSTILDLIGFADSNYACDPEDRKSVMGFCYFTVVSWSSMKPAYNVSFHHLKLNL